MPVVTRSQHPNSAMQAVGFLSHLREGYCWPTPQYRNWCAQHAFFEGTKVEETSPRKVLLELQNGLADSIRAFCETP
jgi:hypothetical protein